MSALDVLLEQAFDKGVIAGLTIAVQVLERSSNVTIARQAIELAIANPPPSDVK